MFSRHDSRLSEIGDNIRKWRFIRGFKQEKLAEELEISKVALSKIENGKTDIPLRRLFAIAEVLNITIQMLFDDLFKILHGEKTAREINIVKNTN